MVHFHLLLPIYRSSSDKEMKRMSKLDDPLEKNAIREKLRAKPGVRREGGDAPRTKGPMVRFFISQGAQKIK